MTLYDLEYILILISLLFMIMGGANKRRTTEPFQFLVFDKNISNILKGIACVFILMGHWGNPRLDPNIPWGISKLVWNFTANIALVWFMFFSGYGLSVKDYSHTSIKKEWINRAKKIYLPLFVVCNVSFVVYCILPDIFAEQEAKRLFITPIIHYVHTLDITHWYDCLKSILGFNEWYVWCILIFYTLFYLSLYINNKSSINQTVVLATLMLIYNLIAIPAFGWKQAHYFRFPWVFMLGHIIAIYKFNPRWVTIMVGIVFTGSLLIHVRQAFVQPYHFYVLLGFFLAILILILLSYFNRFYSIDSKFLTGLGTISYFFYLCHERIAYQLLCYIKVDSISIWCLITIIVSFLLKYIYDKILIQ